MGSKVRKNALLRLLSLYLGEGVEVAVICSYAVIVGLCSLAVPIAVQSVVGSVAAASAIQPIVVLTAFVGGALAFAGFVRLLQIWVAELLQRRLMVRCSITLARRLPQVAAQEFAERYGADYVVRFMELFTIQKLSTVLLLDGSAVFFQILVGLVLVSFYHPFFLAFALVLIVCLSFIVFVLGWGGVTTRHHESEAKYSVLGWLQDLARHPETFKSAHGELYAVERMDQLVSSYLSRRRAHFSVLMRQNTAAIVLQAVTSALLLGLGSYLVIVGQLTLGQLVAAELVFGLVLAGVTKLGKHLESVYDLAASVLKLDSLFNLPIEHQAGSFFGVDQSGASLVVRDLTILSAGYPDPILQKASFSLQQGEKGVVWGPNASGKSVLADVIYRSADAYAGRVEIDNHPVSMIHPRELRSEVSLVRGIELFTGTIEENLLLGNHDVSSEAILHVLTVVGLADNVHSLSNGLSTIITGANHPFSTGEALRLMIARGLLARPRLLVIDGTLDAMDQNSQTRMLQVFKQDVPDVTVLVLTHDQNVARKLARAFEIRNREIIEVKSEVAE